MPGQTVPSRPTVSVIVPVWNVEPWLRECLDSVVTQTIGLDRVELIAVDDGSTDGSGRILDEYAARHPQVVVVHEPNSGGPGRPRNVGLDHATGRYIFFLDADDYLGPEALARLVGMAERNGSDIVLGRMVGVARRPLRTVSFRRNADRADLERVYLSGSVQKLFRRSLLDRTGIRFREGIARLEDGGFMAQVYPEARRISVVADYDCYFLRRRAGSQTRRHDRHDDLAEDITRLELDRMTVLAAHRKPGLGRDLMMVKHIEKLVRLFGPGWRSLDPDERRRVFDVGAAVIRRWHTGLIQRALPAWSAIRAYCLQHGLRAELEDIASCPPRVAFRDPLIERGRVFARYPHFRDGSGIPDSCFDITWRTIPEQRLERVVVQDGRLLLSGEAYLALVGGATRVELRRWPRGTTWQFETSVIPTPGLCDEVARYPKAGFDVAIDLSTAAGGRPLPRGTWRIVVSVGTDRIRRSVPLRAPRRQAAGTARGRRGFAADSGAVYVTPAHEVRLRIGPRAGAVAALELAETIGIRLSHVLVRGLTFTRPGRLLELTMEAMRPGIAAGLFGD